MNHEEEDTAEQDFLYLVYIINKKQEIVKYLEIRDTLAGATIAANKLSLDWPGYNVRYAQVIGQFYIPKLEPAWVAGIVLAPTVSGTGVDISK